MDLRERNALVTGAAIRLGRAIVLGLAEAGANVAIHYNRSEEEAHALLAEVEAKGVRGTLVQADLADPEAAARVMPAAAALGPVSLLVNSASTFDRAGFLGTTLDVWERSMAVDLRAPFILSRALADQLPEGETGRIVNMLDRRALRPGRDHFACTIAGAGLAAMTRSVARALAPRIQVNGLLLGAILPPEGASRKEIDALAEKIPSGRWGTPEEVVDAVLFLLGGPSYITGELIHVDGGRHLV